MKREREMRGVSLEEISAATRISVRFLEALENEQWERLPGGIFNRGFIRSVAKFLGLDEDGLVAEYAMETHERPEIAVWTKEPVRKRPNWVAIGSAIAVVILLILGVWYVHRRYGGEINAWHEEHPIFKTLSARFHYSKVESPSNTPSHVSSSAPSDSSSAATTPPGKQKQAARAAPQGATASPLVPAQPNNSQATNLAAPAAVNPATAPTAAPRSGSSAAPNGPMELKVEAGETSTVTVLADGKTVFSGKLEAQRTLTLHAQKSFTVSSSKSSAVLLELNGHTVPPLGPPGEPGKITLTRANLKPSPGGNY
ncbi:MAG: RodZ domain-containing protein [Candidatus Acidiferrales bacterium]